jgi:hypothetical protein
MLPWLLIYYALQFIKNDHDLDSSLFNSGELFVFD